MKISNSNFDNPNDKFDNRYHQFWQYLTATYDNEIKKGIIDDLTLIDIIWYGD